MECKTTYFTPPQNELANTNPSFLVAQTKFRGVTCGRGIIKRIMSAPNDRYKQSLALISEGQLLSNVSTFINPLMRSVVMSYHLAEACDLKIEIYAEPSRTHVRDIFLIRGNAGGRPGKNKVLWDGTAFSGLKVNAGQYRVKFVVNQRPVAEDHIIRF